MSTRLDRLFILLESGTSNVTRQAAAKQIGEVQKLYPHELHHLLNRLIGYLHNNTWDTRIAAAQAVEAILQNVPEWNPTPMDVVIKKEPEEDNENEDFKNFLLFKNFNLAHVLQKGARLMGSEGSEFDLNEADMHSDPSGSSNNRLKRQRALLNEKLGLTQANKLGFNLTDMITDDDMMNEVESSNINASKVPVEIILKQNGSQNGSGKSMLSCREINRAKRKARQGGGNGAGSSSTCLSRSNSNVSQNGGSSHDEPEKKKSKIDSRSGDKMEIYYTLDEPVPDATGSWSSSDAKTWPLERFCSRLYLDLFNAKWEVRHGAATALRELMKHQSSGAGKSTSMTKNEMISNHNLWLENICLRLLCVLALDRFGDFVSDQVVAPVRETCAQVLGTVLKEMPKDKVHETVNVLLNLIKQNEWEVRHGGLLGLKYMFVVREDLLTIFLPLTINDILIGLFDTVDDVGAVAASTLIPVASWLPKLLNHSQVSSIVKMLWDLLLDQDELTAASNSFMGLLAAILSLAGADKWLQMESMELLIPRLWPFLCHNSSSVRRSTLRTIKTLTENNILSSSNTISGNFDSKNLQINFGVIEWHSQLLQQALRHIYQRVLVEANKDIQEKCKEVWMNLIRNANLTALLHASCPFVSSWICLAMQPPRLAFDSSILIQTKPAVSKQPRIKNGLDDLGGNNPLTQKLYLGGNESTPPDIREKNYIRARINASKLIGELSYYLIQPAPGVIYTEDMESPIDCYTKVLMGHLQSKSSVQRLVCSLIISFWALGNPSVRPGPPKLQEKLKTCVTEFVYYDEVALSFTRLLQDTHDFIATLKQYKIPVDDFGNSKILSIQQIEILTKNIQETFKLAPIKAMIKPKVLENLEERCKGIQTSLLQNNHEQLTYNISTQASLAGAIVSMHCLPEKLNPIIKPLMESLKREECILLQKLSATFLVELLEQVATRNPSPNNKIVTNLCTLLKSDSEFTPKILYTTKTLKDTKADETNAYYGILTLSQQQNSNKSFHGSNGTTSTPSTSAKSGPSRSVSVETPTDEGSTSDQEICKQSRIQRLGATFAIAEICKQFGENLQSKLPILWEIMFGYINKVLEKCPTIDDLQKNIPDVDVTNDLQTSLQLIEIVAPSLHINLHDEFFKLLPKLGVLVGHPLKAIRNMVAKCFANLAAINDCKIMNFIVENVVNMLNIAENVIARQGAVETIAKIVEQLQFKMVPYVVLLIVPLLGRMSDVDESVRLMSTNCFATLIQLMPLDCKIEGSEKLQSRKTKDREFLEHLFAPKSIPDFKVPIEINAELRSYQQAGVNWLWFLNKYNLHGILCDDMGLGKTLQTICILSGDHYWRAENKQANLPSLVICPPTLTGHWVYEVDKFLPTKFLRPLHYAGLPIGREKLRTKVGKPYNLVVASYDTVRKDIEFFSSVNWNYCVLDEGHVIKNGKTKSSKAIKLLKANHRLILSGTPIQNNVLELWSLFDFLMPGFLGTEKQFSSRFSRPILATRDPKSSPKDQEAGVLAMESLHRQILPFLMRRVKEQVLTDLPPKITQDLLCELSPLQQRLYEDFSKTHINLEIKDCIENLGDHESIQSSKKTHIFQALRYLQNVCNHPKLVLSANHPEFSNISKELIQRKTSIDDIEHSAKLLALKQLLLDCGIGVESEAVSQHRALIFCQLKAMIDIIENDLLKNHLPAVTYLRLDGSVPASSRQDIVQTFNNDPSIDCLLLTTQVGGLGLNLTGADTVIFVEHDWNPMKDLQAMDRAHRIGQKKVVNVYRLITQKSLEEKIMGLQKFKILTANTVVSSENSSMETMGTEQLLDLFNLTDEEKAAKLNKQNAEGNGTSSMKNVIENLPELWGENQYEEEYDLSQFVRGLKK